MKTKWSPLFARAVAFVVVALLCSGALHGYSVLTHEEIVDLAWKSEMHPLLLHRFQDSAAGSLRFDSSRADGD